MAKISISKVLKGRQKIRILTLGAGFLILFFFVSMMIADNPKSTKAAVSIVRNTYYQTCVITGTGLTNIPVNCEDYDVTFDGAMEIYADYNIINKSSGTAVSCGTKDSADPLNEACDSKRSFKKLTLKNGASLTHYPLTTAELLSEDPTGDGVANDVTGTARWKKVDLAISGALTLESGAKIDVTGKGYPGGYCNPDLSTHKCIRPHFNGFGPKYGTGIGFYNGVDTNGITRNDDFNPYLYGQGGGNGGNGGNGYYNGALLDHRYTLPTGSNYLFDFGSGGGAAWYRISHPEIRGSDGAAGGGRIRLSVDSLTISSATSEITADGVNNPVTPCLGCSDENAAGGSGAGGTILVQLTGYIDNEAAVTPTAAGGGSPGATDGLKILSLGTIQNVLASVSADGGARPVSSINYSSGGGGVLVMSIAPNISLSKQLLPVSRGGSNSFNPYAIKVGDIIKVKFDISNMTAGQQVSIRDEVLSTTGITPAYRCVPCTTITCTGDAGAANIAEYNPANAESAINSYVASGTPSYMSWSITPSDNTASMYYYCKVK